MYRTNSLRSIIALATVVVMTSGCGALIEKATEKAVEEGVERAIEADSGGDVEIDFSEDGIVVQSDEGDVSFSVDENGVQIDGTDADGNDFSLDADENGIEVDSEDGQLDIDSDGTFTATGEDGEVTTGQINEDDGSFTIEGEDGDTIFRTVSEIPAEWPSDVPQPGGLSDVNGTYISENGEENIVITGRASQSAIDAFDDYADALTDAGFSEEAKFVQGETASGQFVRGDRNVSVSVQADSDGASLTVVVN